MNQNVLKLLAALILFGAWAAIVFFGKTAMPGAEGLIAWIQAALVALVGVHTYGMGKDSKSGASAPGQPEKSE